MPTASYRSISLAEFHLAAGTCIGRSRRSALSEGNAASRCGLGFWGESQRWESNPQPPHYECGALPIEATLANVRTWPPVDSRLRAQGTPNLVVYKNSPHQTSPAKNGTGLILPNGPQRASPNLTCPLFGRRVSTRRRPPSDDRPAPAADSRQAANVSSVPANLPMSRSECTPPKGVRSSPLSTYAFLTAVARYALLFSRGRSPTYSQLATPGVGKLPPGTPRRFVAR